MYAPEAARESEGCEIAANQTFHSTGFRGSGEYRQ